MQSEEEVVMYAKKSVTGELVPYRIDRRDLHLVEGCKIYYNVNGVVRHRMSNIVNMRVARLIMGISESPNLFVLFKDEDNTNLMRSNLIVGDRAFVQSRACGGGLEQRK